ncbi:ABC transporter ATP-binding protein, putative [Babesia ovata]|uniref:ABC transporter ATP-binding protein, putative n=1 Tax=Babesia ovata TaxID=189622 RepID=A0A2H6KAZ9_9APIC|nr:ABC transporter ATP-binding protein, putative [Babesia ovata]GBE60139.1 ABC transporter ATP-binding protein, putative [Babesia ovata]
MLCSAIAEYYHQSLRGKFFQAEEQLVWGRQLGWDPYDRQLPTWESPSESRGAACQRAYRARPLFLICHKVVLRKPEEHLNDAHGRLDCTLG